MVGQLMKKTMKENIKTRVAILDSSNSTLYIEDVLEETIREYGGDIDTYIEENYNTTNCTWMVINSVQYISKDPDPICLDELIDKCNE